MSRHQCDFCGFKNSAPCRSTRDMKEAEHPICYAALMFHGGGDSPGDQAVSRELWQRAGGVPKEPRDADPR